MDKSADPSTPSLAHDRLAHDWETIRTITKGANAIRKAGERFLIKFPAEDQDEYERRLQSAPWRPEFVDCVATLSAKPFTKEVTLADDASPAMVELADDIDGRGNNLHVFAKDIFEGGVAMGASGILVDYPSDTGAQTLADERKLGLRPYWVGISADDILSLVTEQRGGRRVVTYLRIKESRIDRNGFAEESVPLIREIWPGGWRIWRQARKGSGWDVDAEGTMTLDEVPFVFFATNEIDGDQYVKPPLLDVADMQIELYNAGSKKEQAFTVTAAPMLTANGMGAPESGKVETGPNRVLYAPSTAEVAASWAYIQPNASNLKEIREDIREIIEDMRRLGMQPMTQSSGNTPALAFQFDGEKAYTVLQSWALSLKDALEQAFVFTARWMGEVSDAAPSVMVHTDFVVGLYGGTEITELNKARFEGLITLKTYLEELQRRSFLGPQVDITKELSELAKESPTFDPEGTLNDNEAAVA